MIISGQDVRRMRLHAGLGVLNIATKVGVSKKTFQNWENDIGAPKITQFLKICFYCSVSPSRFIDSAEKRTDPAQEINLDNVIESRK